MKSFRLLLPAFVLLVVSCARPDAPTPPREPQFGVNGVDTAMGRKIANNVYWYTAVRPDSVINQNGMLRIVLPGNALGRRVQFEGKGCYAGASPPLGALRSVALHAWEMRDSSIRSDTVQVVMPLLADTVRRGSFLSRVTESCGSGPITASIDVTKLHGST